MSIRRNVSAEFKAKVALEALVGAKTLAELAAKHDVHPNMITQWKCRAKVSLSEAFGKKVSRGLRTATRRRISCMPRSVSSPWRTIFCRKPSVDEP